MGRLLVGLEAGALREALPARGALVGLLPAMHHGVPDEVALLGEAAAALKAAEGLLPRVPPQVLLQLAEAHKALVAVRAAEALVPDAAAPPRQGPHPGLGQGHVPPAVTAEAQGVLCGRRALAGVAHVPSGHHVLLLLLLLLMMLLLLLLLLLMKMMMLLLLLLLCGLMTGPAVVRLALRVHLLLEPLVA